MVDRRSLSIRDMAVAAGILVVSLLLVGGAMGLYSFGNATDNGKAPLVAVISGLERARAGSKLPFVVPVGVPSNWQGNSYQLVTPEVDGGTRTLARAGWLTASGKFITLVQSTEAAADLVSSEIGQGLASRGAVQAGGAEWSVFPGLRQEQVWVREIDSITVLITGSASESDFQVLAAAVAAGT